MSQSTTLRKCLTECEKGAILKVIAVNAGKNAKKRLANMGLMPGTKIVKKKSAPFKGPLEINVKGSSLVIGRGLAEKVMVDCGDSCPV
jgi:DtxR family Mn-dependent transcriptional regulator